MEIKKCERLLSFENLHKPSHFNQIITFYIFDFVYVSHFRCPCGVQDSHGL